MSMLMIEVLTFLLFPIRLPVTYNSNLSGLLHYGCGPPCDYCEWQSLFLDIFLIPIRLAAI